MANETKKKDTMKKETTELLEKKNVLPFGKQNYLLVLVGLALIAIGFVLMTGGGSSDPDVFNEEMFNFQRLTLAPILVLSGFVVEIVAIFWKGKK